MEDKLRLALPYIHWQIDNFITLALVTLSLHKKSKRRLQDWTNQMNINTNSRLIGILLKNLVYFIFLTTILISLIQFRLPLNRPSFLFSQAQKLFWVNKNWCHVTCLDSHQFCRLLIQQFGFCLVLVSYVVHRCAMNLVLYHVVK